MSDQEELQGEERAIAVVGMSGRFPGAPDLAAFWDNLAQGREGLVNFSDEELLAAGADPALLRDPHYVKAGMPINGVTEFDAGFFGYTPGEAAIMDPQQRLFLEHAWEALEHAGYTPKRYPGMIGVYAGVAWNTYLLSNLTTHPELFGGADAFGVFITNDKDFMPTRVSYKLDLKGPSLVIQTSCSTSLVATHLACLSLIDYECDMALVGGVTVKVPQAAGYYYQEGGLSSPDGHCRTFDAEAQGTIFGSGVGVVALKRLADALEDGDTIHAVIRGSAINNDGSLKVSYTAPSVEGQAEVIATAQAVARVEPESIGYVECHGTATALGDPIEVTALTKVFRERTERTQFCALGSVKSNIGHLDAAAGVAGLIKTVLALKHGQIPPSLHYRQPNPKIDFASSPFFVNTTLRPWERGSEPRRAGVSSFGVGGTNAHVIVEEAPAVVPGDQPARPWELLVLSARSAAALDQASANLAQHLRANPALELADVAHTLQAGRAVFRHRRVVVARDSAGAIAALEGREPARLLTYSDPHDPRDLAVAFLFPGQGAQYPGMGRDLYASEPTFREVVDYCAQVLRPHLGLDIRQTMFAEVAEGDSTPALLDTAIAQPALFVIAYALAQLWQHWGVRPSALLGHSVGEYVAACLAGVMSLEDALFLVAQRGRLMSGCQPGAMLAVPLAEAELLPLLGPELSLAAVNEPERCVVAGPTAAIEALEQQLAQREIGARRLHTSHAFHSAMMEPAIEPFVAQVRRVRLSPPQLPYLSNLTGDWITAAQATDPAYWGQHLRGAVRFADGMTALLAEPSRALLEVGPGTTLSTFARGRAGSAPVIAAMRHPRDQQDDHAVLLLALARLWLAGLEYDWSGLRGEERRLRVPLPTYPFERQRFWIEAGARGQAAPLAAPLHKQSDPLDWLWAPSWRRSMPPQPGDEAMPGPWLVFADETGLAQELAALQEQTGQVVALVTRGEGFRKLDTRRYTIDPRRAEDYDALFNDLYFLERLPQTVVHCWSALPADATPLSVARFEQAQELGSASLLLVAQALGKLDLSAPITLAAVSSCMQRVAGEPALHPERATLLGPCRVIPQEYPQLRCRSIDLVLPARSLGQLAMQLLAELRAGAEPVVAYRDGVRWAQGFERLPREQTARASARLCRGGSYLITGALSGTGWSLAQELARGYAARLTLVDDPSTGAAPAELVAALEALGGAALVLEADLTDPAQLRTAIERAEAQYGPLNGVIHAAGTPSEQIFRAVAETGAEELGWHWRPRAHALLALAEALGSRTLDLAVAMSSLATVLGGVGYAAYAAGNCFADAFAQAQAGRSATPWVSIDWDAWQLDDQREQVTAISSDLAQLALTPAEAAAAFERIVALAGMDQVVVSTGDLLARRDQAQAQAASMRGQAASGPAQLHPRPSLTSMYVPPASELEGTIARVWQQLLGIEQIGIHDNFFELGGDSFIAIRVAAQLKKELQIDIPAISLYEGLTVQALAALIERRSQQVAQQAAQQEELKEKFNRRRQFQSNRRAERQGRD